MPIGGGPGTSSDKLCLITAHFLIVIARSEQVVMMHDLSFGLAQPANPASHTLPSWGTPAEDPGYLAPFKVRQLEPYAQSCGLGLFYIISTSNISALINNPATALNHLNLPLSTAFPQLSGLRSELIG